MGTFTKKKVNIYVVDADTDVGTLTGTDVVKGEIREYNFEGAEQEFEIENVFGGQIEIISPRTMATIELTLRPQSEYAARWEDMAYGKVTVGATDVYTPSLTPGAKMIVIEGLDDTNPTTYAFNKARNVSFTFTHNSDESREATISFSLSPEGSEGEANITYAKTDVSGFPAWSAINTAIDNL